MPPPPPTAAHIAVHAGDDQIATAGTAVPVAPAVLVTDEAGEPVPDVAVMFAVTSGGGAVTGADATSGADGIATVGTWTLGPGEGANTLTATAAGSGIEGNPITFTATGVP